jgi:hypothetical protein
MRYVALLLLIVVFLASVSRSFYRTLGSAGLIPDDYRYGDLYRFSNLAAFRSDREGQCTAVPVRKAKAALYAVGDSFMEPGYVNAGDISADYYSYTHWNDHRAVALDTSVRNVLLIESVERHFREHLAKPVENLQVVQGAVPDQTEAKLSAWTDFEQFLTGPAEIRKDFPEERLDNMLFNWDFFLRIREWKAQLNLDLFGRSHPMTSLSPDEQHIFLKLDTDPKVINSNFNELTDEEVGTLVRHLNESADRYKKAGFDEVILSIIPNKTTIAAPAMGRYNRLIERIQQHPDLRLTIVDSYGWLKSAGPKAYQPGDSHWTCESRAKWLTQLNGVLLR